MGDGMVEHPWRLAVSAGIGFGLVYVGGVLWEPGQRLDDEIFARVLHVGDGRVSTALPWIARRLLPVALLIVVGGSAVVALVSRRRRQVVVAATLVVVTVLISRLLRDPILWRPLHGQGYGYPDNTFPSTHVTLVVALAVALWVLVPRGRAWLVPLLVIATALAVAGNVLGHAHRPSDTLGSVLLVGAVAGVVSGLTRRSAPAT